MRYLPKSPQERQQMLREIGCDSIEQLFASIPPEVRLRRSLALGPGRSEPEILHYFRQRALESAQDFACFVGAGAYDHFRPAVVDALISRSEFYTAYTPYQPEISQGTLQATFEFQTLICQLTGMEVANASLYDGSTGLPEAVRMATRINGRRRILLGRSVHPEYRQVLQTYLQHQDIALEEISYAERGQLEPKDLSSRLGSDVAAVVVQSPNFFGIVEDIPAVAAQAHAAGALLIVMIAEPLSLGIFRPPTEADIVAGEGQSLGVPLSFGGALRRIPGRAGKVCAQPAGAAGRPDRGRGRRARVLSDAGHAGTAHPQGKSYFQHLHQSGPVRSHGHDFPLRLRQAGSAGVGDPEPFEDPLRGREVPPGRRPHPFPRPAL